jgi:hypothetical protein
MSFERPLGFLALNKVSGYFHEFFDTLDVVEKSVSIWLLKPDRFHSLILNQRV